MSGMRLLLLPVTSIHEHPHVLLSYDFQTKNTNSKDSKDSGGQKETVMSVFSETVLPSGSVNTVCDMIRKSSILRSLVGVPEDDDALVEAAAAIAVKSAASSQTSDPGHQATASAPTTPPASSLTVRRQSEDDNQHQASTSSPAAASRRGSAGAINKLLEQMIDFKKKVRFYSLGENADVSVCAILVNHQLSFELCDKCGIKNIITVVDHANDRGNSTIAAACVGTSCQPNNDLMKKSTETTERATAPVASSAAINNNNNQLTSRTRHTVIRRDMYYAWICLRDIKDKLIVVDKILKQAGIAHVLNSIEKYAGAIEQAEDIAMGSQLPTDSKYINQIEYVKRQFRCMVWDLLEQKQSSLFPYPCHGRIPNFKGRETAAENLAALATFRQARVVKINPSMAQEHLRFLTLSSTKVLLMPSPGLQSAVPFYKIDPRFLSRKQIQRASTKAGAASLGSMLSVSGLGNLHVDLVVVGSVAVNPITGARLGKGHGYADLEYALMSQIGAVTDQGTVVATTVHENQLINDLPDWIMDKHDLPVNLVATPKRVVFTRCGFDRPKEILWDDVSKEMMDHIPVLHDLRQRVDQQRRESACYLGVSGGTIDEVAFPARSSLPAVLPSSQTMSDQLNQMHIVDQQHHEQAI